MITQIGQILKITKEEDLVKEFEVFETGLHNQLIELRTKLSQSVVTSDVGQIQNHMLFVESWRDRVTNYNSLVSAFVEHCKSTPFLLTGSGVKAADKEAHQKKLAAGFIGLKNYTEELIKSVDSRVNVCKLLMRVEGTTITNSFK